MKGGERPLGYTIVEVLIVLAVSGLMFGIAANFINGKQAKSSFQQGVNETASRIEGVISDVTDGHYSDIRLKCTPSGANLTIVQASAGDPPNATCIFLGKILHFQKNQPNYEVISLAGARTKTGGAPGASELVTNLNDAKTSTVDFLMAEETVPQNLNITKMNIIDDGGTLRSDRWAVGFVQSLGSADIADASDSTYASNGQTVLLAYSNLGSAASPGNALAHINAGPNSVRLARGAVMYLSDGQRCARLTIGAGSSSSNGRYNVETKIIPFVAANCA